MSSHDSAGKDPVITFSAPPFDMVEDLCGDPNADLAIFMAGNQFMVLPELIESFLASCSFVHSVFYETLPPGVVLGQFHGEGIRIGNLELRVAPDVVALSPERIDELCSSGLTGPSRRYASNDLVLIVSSGNPRGITGLADLRRPEIRVAIPDPATEGIGRLALSALELVGGSELRHIVEFDKLGSGTTVFTTIHHRQSPAWVETGAVDCAIVWSTEAIFHLDRGSGLESITIPAEHNRTGDYAATFVTAAPHPQAAHAFVDFLCGESGQALYRKHGFGGPRTP